VNLRSATAVRIPNQECGGQLSLMRGAGTMHLDLRPGGPTGSGDIDHRHTGIDQAPGVGSRDPPADLLDDHRDGVGAADGPDSGEQPAEARIALGLNGLLQGIKMKDQRIGEAISTRRQSAAPYPW
jgi:hypothetical protein